MKRILLIVCFVLSTPTVGQVTTSQLIASVASPQCADPCVVGVCFWLRCILNYCEVETTIRWQHKQPDAVVSAYRQPAQSPWQESQPLLQVARETAQAVVGQPIGGGDANSIRSNPAEQHHLQYFEVDVIGHPVQVANSTPGFNLPYVCPTEATPFRPYFLSIADFASWRSPESEFIYPQTYVPGLREVGPWPLQTWGSIYPRHGFVIQPDPVKAAAVLAQRAIDIATNSTINHVSQQINKTLPRHVDNPGPADESNNAWQMVYPKADNQCHAFGVDPTYELGRVSDSDAYVWNHWQTYQCCVDNPGALFLFSVEIEPICMFGGAS